MAEAIKFISKYANIIFMNLILYYVSIFNI